MDSHTKRLYFHNVIRAAMALRFGNLWQLKPIVTDS